MLITKQNRKEMPRDNQHSHVFLVDISSIGEYKYKPGVKKIGKLLADTVQLAALSSECLIKSFGVVTSSKAMVMKGTSMRTRWLMMIT